MIRLPATSSLFVLAAVLAPTACGSSGDAPIPDGGADVGAYCAAHRDVDEIHITGSARTHDAIVFGTGPVGERRKRENRPLTPKRITSELGNVSPTIVVPGPWSEADVEFQAAHIATQKMHNCVVCPAGIVVIPANRLLNV